MKKRKSKKKIFKKNKEVFIMERIWVNEWADGSGDPLLVADGFDEAIIGVTHDYSSNKVVYDYDKCIEILMRDMAQEDAIEHMSFNVTGAYVGDHTPIFIKLIENNPN